MKNIKDLINAEFDGRSYYLEFADGDTVKVDERYCEGADKDEYYFDDEENLKKALENGEMVEK